MKLWGKWGAALIFLFGCETPAPVAQRAAPSAPAPVVSAVASAEPAPSASSDITPLLGTWIGQRYAEALKKTRSPRKSIEPCPPAQLILGPEDGKLMMHRDMCLHEGQSLAISPTLADGGKAITLLPSPALGLMKWSATIEIGTDQLTHGNAVFVPARSVAPGATTFDDVVGLTTIGKTAYTSADGKAYSFKPKGEAVWAGARAGYVVESHYQGNEPLGSADGYIDVGPSPENARERTYAFAMKPGGSVDIFLVPKSGALPSKPDIVLTPKP